MASNFEVSQRELERAEMAREVLRSTGFLRIRVLGMSMIPTIWPGDIVSVEGGDRAKIVPGTIALFTRDGRFFMHRIIRKLESQDQEIWISRGDAMAEGDPAWKDCELLARVTKIERRGRTFLAKRTFPLRSRILARILCHSGLFRNVALRIHFSSSANNAPSRQLQEDFALTGA